MKSYTSIGRLVDKHHIIGPVECLLEVVMDWSG